MNSNRAKLLFAKQTKTHMIIVAFKIFDIDIMTLLCMARGFNIS